MRRTATRPFEIKFAKDGPPGTFSGYGAVFGNVDDGGDVLVKGAFAASLAGWKARGKLPKMLWQHGLGASAEDKMPVGYWTAIEEDAHGLKVVGQLDPIDTERGRTLLAGLRNGSIDAMSITYSAVDVAYGKTAADPVRTITKVELYEVGPVLWGMNPLAGIEDAKAASRIRTIRDFEAFLRDAGGFSHAAARAIASGGYKANPNPRDEGGMDDLLDLQRQAESLFSTT